MVTFKQIYIFYLNEICFKTFENLLCLLCSGIKNKIILQDYQFSLYIMLQWINKYKYIPVRYLQNASSVLSVYNSSRSGKQDLFQRILSP